MTAACARTPEELDTLLEDAVVMRDAGALAQLFEDAGVLIVRGLPAAHGRTEICRVGPRLWLDGPGHLADPDHVLISDGVALVVHENAIQVMRRGHDRSWLYLIALLGTFGDHSASM